MRGEKWLTVKYRKLVFTMTLHRNITVVMGDSGSGKTTFASLIREYREHDGVTEVRIHGSTNVYVLGSSWFEAEPVLQNLTNTIVIVDEGAKYLYDKCFADAIKKSSNYFVLIGRRPLKMIPYSYTEIVYFKTTQRNNMYITEAQKLVNYYSEISNISTILVEDSNSGFSMYSAVYPELSVQTAAGNSNVFSVTKRLLEGSTHNILVIADGAAFGPYAQELIEYLSNHRSRLILWLPESFEYLLLLSKIVHKKGTEDILRNPIDYIESRLFDYWEQYFTFLVSEILKGYTGKAYSKSKLSAFLLSDTNTQKFKNIVPVEIQQLLDKH